MTQNAYESTGKMQWLRLVFWGETLIQFMPNLNLNQTKTPKKPNK